MPAKAQPTAATTKESTTAGPALSAATMPVSENSPAPMMAPMPSATRLTGPSVRFKWWVVSSDSARITSTDFVRNRLIGWFPLPKRLSIQCCAARALLGAHACNAAPFLDSLPQVRGGCARWQQIGDHRYRIGAGIEDGARVFTGNAADPDQRFLDQRAAAPQLVDADGRVGILLGGSAENGAKRYVIHWLRRSVAQLRRVVRRVTDHGFVAQQRARVGGREIVLPHVQPRAEQLGDIGAIVHDQRGARLPAQRCHLSCVVKNPPAPQPLVPDLQNARAAFDHGCRSPVSSRSTHTTGNVSIPSASAAFTRWWPPTIRPVRRFTTTGSTAPNVRKLRRSAAICSGAIFPGL